MKVEQVNKFAQVKQRTDRDIRYLGPLVSDRAPTGLTTTAGQTVINLSFAVQQTTAGKQIFFLALDGAILAETSDFTFTNIISGQSSQITLTTPAVAGMQIDYWKVGTNITGFPSPSSMQAGLNNLTAGQLDSFNGFVKTSTTNTSFSSTLSNNPYTLYFDDCAPRFGIERVMFSGLEAIPVADGNTTDSTGRIGYYPVNAVTARVDKRIRFYGTWVVYNTTGEGFYIRSNTASDYITITGIYNKINVLVWTAGTSAVESVYLNGVDTTNNITHSNSTVLDSRNYQSNTILNANLGSISVGLNTVKLLKDDSNGSAIYGVELVNEQYDSTHNIHVTAGTQVIGGTEVTFPAYVGANALNYKGQLNTTTGSTLYSGTKGARQAWFAKADTNGQGIYVSKQTVVEEQIQSGVVAYNSTSSDSVTGLTDSSKYYANSQGNIVRVKDATSVDRLMLVPTAAPSGTSLTFANDFDGSADTTLFAGNLQFRDDSTTGVTFADAEACTIELYGKCLANADFSNSELQREVHWREFGAGRSDDFSTLTTSAGLKFYSLDDGVTTLVGSSVAESSGEFAISSTNYYVFTFVGTGLEIYNTLSAPKSIKIISDLPYGVHTCKVYYASGTTSDIYIDGIKIASGASLPSYSFSFRIYQPKTPVLVGYKPVFAYNILADQVLTTLPTRNVVYSGYVDQGNLRKMANHEFVHTGSGSWNIQNYANGTAGAHTNLNGSNDGQAAITLFSANKFRFFFGVNNTSDSFTVNVDGVAVETNVVPGAANWHGWHDSNLTLSSLGIHTIQLRRGSALAAAFPIGSIDYNTPTYEPVNWKTNPYLDYFNGSNSVGNYLKTNAVDIADQARLYNVVSTVADSTGIPTTDLLMCVGVLDKGTWLLSSAIQHYKNSVTDVNLSIRIYADGVAIPFAINETKITVATFRAHLGLFSVPVTLNKKSAVTVAIRAGTAGHYTYESTASNARPCHLLATKISN